MYEVKQHPNLIIGSLQLIIWFFYHPSAWKNHIKKIDSDLDYRFCLADLNPINYKSHRLRRLFIQGYLILPLIFLIIVSLIVAVIGGKVLFSFILFISSTYTMFLLLGMTISFPVSIIAGLTFGITLSLIATTSSFSPLSQITIANGVSVCTTTSSACNLSGTIYPTIKKIRGTIFSTISFAIVLYFMVNFIVDISSNEAFVVTKSLADGSSIYESYKAKKDIIASFLYGLGIFFLFTFILRIRINKWNNVLKFSAILGLVFFLVYSFFGSVGAGFILGIVYSLIFALPYVIANRFFGSWAGAAAAAIGNSFGSAIFCYFATDYQFPLAFGIFASFLGLTMNWWRPIIFYPIALIWNTIIYKIDKQQVDNRHSNLLYLNSAFWDEFQRLPLFGLENHLVLFTERNPAKARLATEYLSTNHQKWAALETQIELDFRRLKNCIGVEDISAIHKTLGAGKLQGQVSDILRSFSQISKDVNASLNQLSNYNQRITLEQISEKLSILSLELTRSTNNHTKKFSSITPIWREKIDSHIICLEEIARRRKEIDNPYIIGLPLTTQQKTFVGRTDISIRMEELLSDILCPPLLLYGQRRTGKTSLLLHLNRLLSNNIVPIYVDLQGRSGTSASIEGFLENFMQEICRSIEKQDIDVKLPILNPEDIQHNRDPFTFFYKWLDQLEDGLSPRIALLALDEFEMIDKVFEYSEYMGINILNMLRHIIQHHSCFKIILSGSHSLEEFQRWSSYLINVQVIHIGYLYEEEASKLITKPIKSFNLIYSNEALKKVIYLTRCHPYLVQLLCREIVNLKNDQTIELRMLVIPSDVEEAVWVAIGEKSSMFFDAIGLREINSDGTAILRHIANYGEGAIVRQKNLTHICPNTIKQTIDLLLKREFIEYAEGGFRFQVELIRRWFTNTDSY